MALELLEGSVGIGSQSVGMFNPRSYPKLLAVFRQGPKSFNGSGYSSACFAGIDSRLDKVGPHYIACLMTGLHAEKLVKELDDLASWWSVEVVESNLYYVHAPDIKHNSHNLEIITPEQLYLLTGEVYEDYMITHDGKSYTKVGVYVYKISFDLEIEQVLGYATQAIAKFVGVIMRGISLTDPHIPIDFIYNSVEHGCTSPLRVALKWNTGDTSGHNISDVKAYVEDFAWMKSDNLLEEPQFKELCTCTGDTRQTPLMERITGRKK